MFNAKCGSCYMSKSSILQLGRPILPNYLQHSRLWFSMSSIILLGTYTSHNVQGNVHLKLQTQSGDSKISTAKKRDCQIPSSSTQLNCKRPNFRQLKFSGPSTWFWRLTNEKHKLWGSDWGQIWGEGPQSDSQQAQYTQDMSIKVDQGWH